MRRGRVMSARKNPRNPGRDKLVAILLGTFILGTIGLFIVDRFGGV